MYFIHINFSVIKYLLKIKTFATAIRTASFIQLEDLLYLAFIMTHLLALKIWFCMLQRRATCCSSGKAWSISTKDFQIRFCTKNAKWARKDTKTMKQKLKSNLPKRRKDCGKKVGVSRSQLSHFEQFCEYFCSSAQE